MRQAHGFSRLDLYKGGSELLAVFTHFQSSNSPFTGNVFIMEDGSLKLGDLGLGRYLDLQSILAFSQVSNEPPFNCAH